MKQTLKRYARSAMTDQYGEAVFNNLKPGKYFLLAYPEGISHEGNSYHPGETGKWTHWESTSYYRVEAAVAIAADGQQAMVIMKNSSLIEKQVRSGDFR